MDIEIKKALEETVSLLQQRNEILDKIEQQKKIIRAFTKGKGQTFRRQGFASIHVAPLKTRRLLVEPSEATKVTPEILSELIKEKTIFVRVSESKFDALDETIKSQLLDSNFIQSIENPEGVAKQAVRVRFLDQKNTNNEDSSSTSGVLETHNNDISDVLNDTETEQDEDESEDNFQTLLEDEGWDPTSDDEVLDDVNLEEDSSAYVEWMTDYPFGVPQGETDFETDDWDDWQE
jgi:hypothetical protein